MSKYEVFCKVIELGNFTKAAEVLNYSQSAVSQTIKALETELGTALVTRDKSGIRLTYDGRHYYPFIQAVCYAERALRQKQREMNGLENTVIKIGTFASVSRHLLPPLMRKFKNIYPHVRFVLTQGEYSNITDWIDSGSVDFGFVNADETMLKTKILLQDEMLAVLPKNHPLAGQKSVSLRDLTGQPLILLDEGEHSVALAAFKAANLSPQIEYTVFDDYTIPSMIEQNLGISMMYRLTLSGIHADICTVPIAENPRRNIALAWKEEKTMSLSARNFLKFIIENAN